MFIKHGYRTKGNQPREYGIWESMRRRCNTKTQTYYYMYGGSGIKVCKRWDSFPNFLADMGKCPEGRSLDRIDGTKGYEPNNCRWATNAEQHGNKRTNVYFTYKGKKLCISHWEKEFGFHEGFIRYRLKIGFTFRKAVNAGKKLAAAKEPT